ncbi:type II secretion system minor pseudopilin GspJ [Escherichia coli]|uniref:type II secretion system minor pseudopilin GspJ n=1 Tax=Escherichia coli TaxID=562 RepID=UPI000C795A28|nr:type II secretion system minor pseudopilin GspJ [Escherichia coli]AUM10829.1 type II secretion system protein GspJ [Escherichia coli]EKY6398841.1 type II secretion system minor pseudopilin GspJ [Escherichia coli]MBZ8327418.1 type II secretion system minor pseudopilin GspJ [Escherichia coli]QWV76966.1 type II secretion system minor pseudopilin GspJ [Escherichia coli O170:H18]
MSGQQVHGFTLLEMLIALVVFSSLSLGAFQVLQNSIRADEQSRNKAYRLAELQRAFSQIERDIISMISRRSQGNDRVLLAAPSLLQSDDWGVMFTRNSWQNPFGIQPRSDLQRVGYRVQQQKLERLSYFYAEQSATESPNAKTLLNGVEMFRLRFYSEGAWQDSWNRTTELPQCIEIILVVDDFAQITRLFLISKGND